jgi:hypothetical protein
MLRKIILSAVNIVTHPHSTEDYVKIFKKARDLKQLIKIHGDRHAVLRSIWSDSAVKSADKLSNPIYGEIYSYIQLGDDAWFDLLEGEPATPEEAAEVKIPSELVPHLKRIAYVFFPDKHLFVYVSGDSNKGSMSPPQMKGFLEKLFNDNRITEIAEFDTVEVRTVQSKETVTQILESLSIEKLTIQLNRPNDTGSDPEKSIEEEMEEQGLARMEIFQRSSKHDHIKPNKKTREYMEAALTNGFVEAIGYDDNDNITTLKTIEKPFKDPYKLDEDQQTYLDAFLENARKVVRKIYPRKRGDHQETDN